MATITGYTAARMQAIEDGTVTTGLYDASGHLILTKHDGTQIDVGRTTAATTAQSGIVELATNAETQAGTDATRAVTPAGLASLSGYRVQLVSGIAETATPASWPYGVSMQSVTTGSGWTPANGFGTVVTDSVMTDRTTQTFWASAGGTSSVKCWTRSYHSTDGGGGWTAWAQQMLMVNLSPASFTQATTRGNYPIGQSRLYYTAGSAGSWDFASLAPGEVITYIADDANYFGRQTFTQHAGGSSKPVQWFRTADQVNGWTAWQKVVTDPGAWVPYTPVWNNQGSGAQPSFGNATLNCKYQKIGRVVTVFFWVNFGSTTAFGSTATTDNWQFSLPVPAANSTDDSLGYLEMYQDATHNGLGRVKLYTTTGFKLGVGPGSTSGIGGDVDSATPFIWASGNYVRGTFTYESAS